QVEVGVACRRRQLGDVAHGDAAQRPADARRVAVEGRHHVEPLPLETAVQHERGAEVADADHADPPAAIESQDRADLLPQVGDVVAEAAAPERTERGEVLADLGRRHAFALGQAVRGDETAALGLDFYEHAVVVRETAYARLGDARHA